MATAKYSAESLQVLSGLEPVRRRPGMYTDTTRPNHLVQEVVDNSVDEALAGFAREIEVTLMKDGSVEVIDDGPGLPEKIRADIFDPFVSGKENGTGLGLALVSKIISDHDGWISVDSVPGRTVFRISLPRATGKPAQGKLRMQTQPKETK